MLRKYIELHPDFPYKLNISDFATADVSYEYALDQGLASGIPDLYCVESASVLKYTKGEMAHYALPYEDLGIDVNQELKQAQIAQYVVDIGTRTLDGKLVALAYQGTGGALIYRRSLAKATWGTDNPVVIEKKVGPGWDKFFAAAKDLKRKGFAIVSSEFDIWHSIENSADRGWLTADGKLYIDPKREAFLDMAKQLKTKGYSNNTQDWTDPWYIDMAGKGPKPVFCFFGPAWLVNYVMAGHSGAKFDNDGNVTDKTNSTYGDWAVCLPPVGFYWGGTWLFANQKTLAGDPNKKSAVKALVDWITLDCTREGLQYQWANGTIFDPAGTKDTAASETATVMADGKLDFLGGQNMFDAFIPANQMARGKNLSVVDQPINILWREQVQRYVSGQTSRGQAIMTFIQNVKEQLKIDPKYK